MQAYLINLDRSPERLAEADAQLRAAGVAYVRVPAVDGLALPPRERRRAVNRLRYCLIHADLPNAGTVGCALSHQAVYRRMAEAGVPLAAVFEDDVTVPEPACLREALARIEATDEPAVPTVWRLGRRPGEPGGLPPGLYPVTAASMGTYAYALNLAAAKRLTALNGPPIVTLADDWPRFSRLGVRVWSVRPEPCGHGGESSTISVEPQPRRARWGWYVALWRARRRALHALDWLATRLTGR